MVEIAICLAIIGIALVSIIGVLPSGMHTQQDNREETIINQDATMLLEAIRGGAHGLDDLTNYVYAISNYWAYYVNGTTNRAGVNSYTFTGFSVVSSTPYFPGARLTNGVNIIGLLSTPEFMDNIGNPTNNLFSGGYSNHVYAYVRSLSGPAVEKPPQDNDLLRADSFSYRLLCVNAPVAVDTNLYSLVLYPNGPPAYVKQLSGNLHELGLSFAWPLLPNGGVPQSHKYQTFRTLVAGQLAVTTNLLSGQRLYFYQSQSFANFNP